MGQSESREFIDMQENMLRELSEIEASAKADKSTHDMVLPLLVAIRENVSRARDVNDLKLWKPYIERAKQATHDSLQRNSILTRRLSVPVPVGVETTSLGSAPVPAAHAEGAIKQTKQRCVQPGCSIPTIITYQFRGGRWVEISRMFCTEHKGNEFPLPYMSSS